MVGKFDFEQDLRNIVHEEFQVFGASVGKDKKIEDLLLDFLTLQKKIIPPIKRTVLINPVFKIEINGHPKKEIVEHIIKLLETGKDVNYFQSDRLFQTRFHDNMLYEWNIFHFHLSLDKEKKSNFMKRTNQLLFCYITKEKAIMLGVEKHSDTVFSDSKWFEILHDHFPEEIKHYKDSSIKDIKPDLSASERKKVWDAGLTSGFLKIKDTIYISPGIGRTVSGHSMLVTKSKLSIIRWLHSVEKQFFEYVPEIYNFYRHPIHPKLILTHQGFNIVDKNNKAIYLKHLELFSFG